MKVFISGQFYDKKQFSAAERYLKSLGHIVVNPTIIPAEWGNCSKIYFEMLNQCDAICMLPGWEHSTMAKLHHEYALGHGMIEIPVSNINYVKACPECGGDAKCVDSRVLSDGTVKRRKVCMDCNFTWFTLESQLN